MHIYNNIFFLIFYSVFNIYIKFLINFEVIFILKSDLFRNRTGRSHIRVKSVPSKGNFVSKSNLNISYLHNMHSFVLSQFYGPRIYHHLMLFSSCQSPYIISLDKQLGRKLQLKANGSLKNNNTKSNKYIKYKKHSIKDKKGQVDLLPA